jgi:adenylate cyclase
VITRRLAAGAMIGAAAAVLVIAAARLAPWPFEAVELKTYDWRISRTARPETARDDIALVEIDESTLRNLEPNVGRWPWPRMVHAIVIDYLAHAGARLIVYDINFAEPDRSLGYAIGGGTMTGEESDEALATSIRDAGNVLMVADASYDGDATGVLPIPDEGYRLDVDGIIERRTVYLPFPRLGEGAVGFGHNLFVLDADGPLRHAVPFVRRNGRAMPLLGAAAALRVLGVSPADVRLDGTTLRLGDRAMPLEWREVRTADGPMRYLWSLVDFRGPAVGADLTTHTYPTYTFFDLLYSEEQIQAGVAPKVDPSAFRGKIVFVGATASGLFDVFETPFSNGKMPGIQVHAAVADDILSNRFLRRASSRATLALAVTAAIAVGVLAAVLPAWWAAAGTAVLLAAFGFAAVRLFAGGVWVNVTQPAAASATALFGGVAYQYLVEGREKRRMRRLFGQYVSKDVCEQLVANPALARLGGTRREMTVLFSDIRGFTTVSEQGEPEAIVHLLNEYFTRMVEIVFRHHGTVDKFVGDQVMALFGAPLDDEAHADHAAEAALEMVAALERLCVRWREEGRPELAIGVGISTGPMIAGNIGSEAIMSYTVIGDAVNLGARLESLNKTYGTRIIISDATRARLTRAFDVRPLGEVVVKGKTRPVSIFELVAAGGSRT